MPFLRRLGWTILIVALLIVLWRAANLLLLVFGSVLGAVVFLSAGRAVKRLGVRSRRISLACGILIVLTLFGLTGWLLTVQFGQQVVALITDLPSAMAEIEKAIGDTPAGEALITAVRSAVDGSTFADMLAGFALGVGEILLNFIIVVVGAIFIAVNPRVYVRGIVLLTPPAGRLRISKALFRIGKALRLWLHAQLIQMISMGVLVSAALWMVGLESWGALGLLAGLSEFVPYVGPALAMVPALALALGHGGEQLVLVLLAFAGVRLIQTNLVTPAVTRRVVAIPPALTLFVILAVGAVFGIYGLFFSAALLVVAFVGIRELYLRNVLGEEDIDAIPRRH